MFAQVHEPGEAAQSDSTHMTELGVTLGGVPFPHLVYHLVLVYSNVEAVQTHYGVQPTTNNLGVAHENGDVEQQHFRFKKAVEEALRVRGSPDFADDAYGRFLLNLVKQRNLRRQVRWLEEPRSSRATARMCCAPYATPTIRKSLCRSRRGPRQKCPVWVSRARCFRAARRQGNPVTTNPNGARRRPGTGGRDGAVGRDGDHPSARLPDHDQPGCIPD